MQNEGLSEENRALLLRLDATLLEGSFAQAMCWEEFNRILDATRADSRPSIAGEGGEIEDQGSKPCGLQPALAGNRDPEAERIAIAPEQIAELRRIAEAVTPWSWEADADRYGAPFVRTAVDEERSLAADRYCDHVNIICDFENADADDLKAIAAHIAAFDPPTVLALLDALDQHAAAPPPPLDEPERAAGAQKGEAWGILNPYGELWTHQTFPTERAARDYVDAFWRWPGAPETSGFTTVRVNVRVSVAPPEQRAPSTLCGDEQKQARSEAKSVLPNPNPSADGPMS
jgi:hypothetical protein